MIRSKTLKTTAVIFATALAAVLPPASGTLAQRDRREVREGQSIQAAIDAAPPGATIEVGPGTYRENVLIAKDGITLAGAGSGRTLLEPPAQRTSVCPLSFPPADVLEAGLNGICVANVDQHGNVQANARCATCA
jgi:hypothetical protein